VLAETYARLRGEPFRVAAEAAASLLSPWWTKGEILATPAELYARALEDAPTLNLGGQIHDYLIALTCAHPDRTDLCAPRLSAGHRRPPTGRPCPRRL
jgi:hypothetical protein